MKTRKNAFGAENSPTNFRQRIKHQLESIVSLEYSAVKCAYVCVRRGTIFRATARLPRARRNCAEHWIEESERNFNVSHSKNVYRLSVSKFRFSEHFPLNLTMCNWSLMCLTNYINYKFFVTSVRVRRGPVAVRCGRKCFARGLSSPPPPEKSPLD